MSEEDETRTHTGLAHYPLKVARLPFRHLSIPFVSFILLRASCRIRTNDPEITNHVLWPTELKRRSNWSGRRGSNPRPPGWQARALSTELLPRFGKILNLSSVGTDGFEPPKAKASRFTVCPIWPLCNMPETVFQT